MQREIRECTYGSRFLAETTEEINDALDAEAAKLKIVKNDGMELERQPLRDQIAIADRKANQAALAGGIGAWGAIRKERLVPPGTQGPRRCD